MTPSDHFESRRFDAAGVGIHARVSRGSPQGRTVLLLLHGFPQTQRMWDRVAQRLAKHFFLVMPDLRGYGDSDKPTSDADHTPYSKRTMAADMLAVMDALGVDQFGVCGHDRGARVAHRMALDAPQRVQRLCLIDIVPTLDVYAGHWAAGAQRLANANPHSSNWPMPAGDHSLKDPADGWPAPAAGPLIRGGDGPALPRYFALAQAYEHWFSLTQPAPFPETLIGGAAKAYLHAKLSGWGAVGMGHIEPDALAEYERCFCRPETIAAVCEDYRASATIDLAHDHASRHAGQHIACDLLLLWGARGVVHQLFEPLGLWRGLCKGRVLGGPLPAGHYIPEEQPIDTAEQLRHFFANP
jgi:haloacetate dehalogenase